MIGPQYGQSLTPGCPSSGLAYPELFDIPGQLYGQLRHY
jgi:hypothetical protein